MQTQLLGMNTTTCHSPPLFLKNQTQTLGVNVALKAIHTYDKST